MEELSNYIKDLSTQVNLLIKDTPLIFFSREVERATGLEDLLENYHICCVEDSYLVRQLQARGKSIFCLEQVDSNIESKSTNELLKHPKTKEWIAQLTKGGKFYGITFKPTNIAKFHIEKNNGIYLGNDLTIVNNIENKIFIDNFFKTNNISIPKSRIEEIGTSNFEALKATMGQSFMIQMEKGHTGTGTFKIETEEEYNKVIRVLSGNKVKIAEFINGTPITLNCVIFDNDMYIGPIQYQITGIPNEPGTEGVTIGNDFSIGGQILQGMNALYVENFAAEISRIGKGLFEMGYKGIFGLDLILSEEKPYFIEINARQTANIPFQTQLELKNLINPPQFLLHIAAFLGVKTLPNLHKSYKHLSSLEGSQVIVRATQDNYVLQDNLKSGIYRLQSDNAALDWSDSSNPEQKANVIYLDEEKDMPLIWQSDSYKVDDVNGGFLLLFQNKARKLNLYDEIARFQFSHESMQDGKLKQWLIDAYNQIK